MIKVSMNIGGSSGSYTNVPMFWELENAKTFTDFIRDQMFNIILYSHYNYGIKSNLWLGVHIEEYIGDDCFFWDFIISCKNIREFKQFAEMTREEIDLLKIGKERNEKIEELGI